jgi:hypothetical protein
MAVKGTVYKQVAGTSGSGVSEPFYMVIKINNDSIIIITMFPEKRGKNG